MLRDASVWVDYFQSKRIPVAFARWHSFIVFKLKNNGKFHREGATAIHVCEKIHQMRFDFKKTVYMKKNINSHGISSVHQHGRRFIIVLEHHYGCREVM